MAEITDIPGFEDPAAAHRPAVRVRRPPGCDEPAEGTLTATCLPPYLLHRETDAPRP